MRRLSCLLFAGVFAISACVKFPGAQEPVDVSKIQTIYDQDFRIALATDGLDAKPSRFSRTLRALDEAGTPDSPALKAYYDLLAGLIFVQTGQLGEAAAIAPQIEDGVPLLKTEGIERRNTILAESFDAMVAGKTAVETLQKLTRNTEEQHVQRIEIVSEIESSTKGLARDLCKHGPESGGDDGVAFVAANQASFLVEADRAMARACIPRATDPEACSGFLNDRSQLQTARDLLATFASDTSDTSQIAQLQNTIERDLAQAGGGAATSAPVNLCQ